MGVVLRMFRELARLGVSRAAAFFYAVAVGVVANVVIAHLSPHDGTAPTLPTSWPAIAKPETTPVATATIAPRLTEAKPAEPAHAIEASAPATSLPPVPPPALLLPAAPPPTVAAISSQNPPAQDVPAPLPAAATMAAPLLKPAAVASAPPPAVANIPSANPPPVAAPITTPPSAPVAAEAKPAPDQPANNVEAAAAGSNSAAPISLLPSDPAQPAADPAPPKPSKPGPGSGGLY